MARAYADFFAAIRLRESSGNYHAVNTLNYLGAYQFGEAALVDLGLAVRDANPFNNDYSLGFTGKFGVSTKAEFLASAAAQDAAADEWWSLLWARVRHADIEIYDQQVLNGVRLTKTGMIAASHLLGTGALVKFIQSGGTDAGRDAYGTTLTEYLKLFADYDAPESFLNNLGKGNKIVGGIGPDQLRGFTGADTLLGGGGKDWLIGGEGADVLTGGRGVDRFFYASASDGGDVITDFRAVDFFVVEGSAFGLGDYSGVLPGDQFRVGHARDADDHFIFHAKDDTLWFDANANKPAGLTLLADLKTDIHLTAVDILVV